MKKRIIIGTIKSFNIYASIIKNMELYGYEVISICYDDNFVYKNFKQRATNFIRKVFFNDSNYKYRLKIAAHEEEIYKVINNIEDEVDYTLIIRPDTYTKEIVSALRKKSKKLIAYQWDGLDRFPAIFSYINMFDRFFIFDKNDQKYTKYKLLPITNFYFDYDKDIPNIEVCKIDVFFVGSFIRNRMESIIGFSKKAKELNLKTDIRIVFGNKRTLKKYIKYDITCIQKPISYVENIHQLKKAKVIIDFLYTVHNGLSLRTFEALYYNKKMITTNQTINKYDFYHPNNIFIWDGVNLDGLDEFIRKPYVAVEESIKQKYGFKNWLNYVLDTGDYTPINLPEE